MRLFMMAFNAWTNAFGSHTSPEIFSLAYDLSFAPTSYKGREKENGKIHDIHSVRMNRSLSSTRSTRTMFI
jgi:hypothetical protein